MDRLQRLAERLALAQQEKVSRRMGQVCLECGAGQTDGPVGGVEGGQRTAALAIAWQM